MARILIGGASVVAVLLVVLIVVLVTREDGGAASATTNESTTTEMTTTTELTTTTEPAATTAAPTTTAAPATTAAPTTTVAVACPGVGVGPIPTGAAEVTPLAGDFDGDGTQDRFVTYVDSGGLAWARVELSYGYATQVRVPGTTGVIDSRVNNFGAPGDIGITLSIGSPSTRVARFYAMYGCSLDLVTKGSGDVAEFSIGNLAMYKSGVTCTSAGLAATEASDIGGSQWEVSSVTYLWVPGLGELQGSMGASAIFTSPADDDVINGAAQFNC